ncbi:formate dehydrogenase subunit gamma [Campylobacter sp.]|uniref:formate dehydrogenase subunit gamma n=1 Tax=Campylobacter sp. TaxID=205 RepID=UPI0025BD0760|nr:formate dehydrogenase subunit gamma [Campylobacter sp.]
MCKVLLVFLACLNLLVAADVSLKDTQIWNEQRVLNINSYENFGALWTKLQGEYIASAVFIILILVISIFALHYMVIGPKKFSHDGKKIYAFSTFERLFHFVAAISWIILVPTGLVMIFGSYFGGGFFVRMCKNLHGIATILFIISVIPMLLCWIKRMLPASYDLRWMMIVGGYLSKEKRPVPAGKFNFGQKSWYYIAVFGGFIMITTGAFMFFLDFNSTSLQTIFGISHIDILRISAIVHNILGILCAVFFAIHIYMAVFAIKGSIHSMINGYKEEEEVYILHSYWYKELSDKKQINPSYIYDSETKI